jgi:hypothetical protein
LSKTEMPLASMFVMEEASSTRATMGTEEIASSTCQYTGGGQEGGRRGSGEGQEGGVDVCHGGGVQH